MHSVSVRRNAHERGQRHGRVFADPPRRDAASRRQGCKGKETKGVPHAAVLHEFVLSLCAVPQSIFELDPGILLFDLGASLLCHKTGNHLTGWMTGSCWAPLGLGAHCSSPAHTPCHPPPPPSPHHFSHGRGYTMRSSPEGGTSPNFSPGQAVQN